MPHTGIANLEFYRLETDKAQPSLSCSRNNLFAASSVVLLVSSGLSSLISRIWARDRGLTTGSIDLGVRSHVSARLPCLQPIFSGICDAQHAWGPSRTILVSNIGVNSALQG